MRKEISDSCSKTGKLGHVPERNSPDVPQPLQSWALLCRPGRKTSVIEKSARPLIGFLGIGAMGLPMAHQIHAGGHRVRTVDLNPRQVTKALELGIPSSTSADDIANADALFVVVATGEQLFALLDSRLLSGAGTIKTLVVLSTVGVDAVKDFALVLGERGIGVVDCPVTGGVTGAINGQLKLFAAGHPNDLKALRGILETMGTIQDCGGAAGDGQAYKMVNQLLAASHLAVAAEAIDFARALGLDSSRVLEAVTAGAGASWMLIDRGPRMIQAAEQRPVETHLSIFVKDADLVLRTAAAVGFNARIFNTVGQELVAAASQGLDAADDSSIVDLDRSCTAPEAAADYCSDGSEREPLT
ncbi:NAD(P)-dependent oxidoreductase [Arthrobacter sp. OAP107]|uniref:NAD(P)-dependent oxidoreductase n=1 Tax=Arthrobacter sp. OAP107 TaxID=3156445 RepID=UPI00339AA17F